MSGASGATLMIAGGGTGGHIYPALAIAQEFMARGPSRKVVFVGTPRGLEVRIVPRAGFPLELISIGGLKGKSILESVGNLFRLPLAFTAASGLISRHRPDVILGVGGYASGPTLVAGRLRGIPTMIHEQNAFPGLTNRLLSRVATQIAVAFPEALARFGKPGVVTGNPIRKEFFDQPANSMEPDPAKIRVLIFGGSQGSRILNDTMTGALLFLARLKDQLEIVHQTGPGEHPKVVDAYKASAFNGARVVPYLDAMAEEMRRADLVVSRAGAMTIAELAASGRPAILVPFALATNNHQEVNARVMEAAGAALVITEKELSAERLAGAISALATDPGRRTQMSLAAQKASSPDAAAQIVTLIEKLIALR